MKPRRAVTYVLFAVGALLVVAAAAAMPRFRNRHVHVDPPPPPPPPIVHVDPPLPPPPPPIVTAPAPQPQVDVVFALDTTSSMDSLIDGAKRKIWSLVNFISSAQPQPKVRVGLVAYRDRGDTYVTRFYDLSDDMDAVFQHLRGLRAEGGGDTPEHVAKALHDAVIRPSWSQGDKVVKIVYLVGDAPGHTDYGDYDYQQVARKAADLGIRVNTVRCGDDPDAGRYFRRIADLGKGQYATVDESGGVADERTPFDDKLAMLNRRLVGTAVGYGRGAGALGAKAAEAVDVPAAVAADRAAFAARKKIAVSGEGDLINEVATKGADYVNAVPAAALPAPVAAMAPAARVEYVEKKKAERDEVMKEIERVASERDAYLKKSAAAKPRAKAGFDDNVKKTLVEQSAGVLAF